MKSNIYVFSFLLLLITLYIGAFRNAGKWLIKEDIKVHADAIVILMGSLSDRVIQATDLYNQTLADKVLIVGPVMRTDRDLNPGAGYMISNSEEARNALIANGLPSENIYILYGDSTRSTLTEAIAIREYLVNKPDIDTLLLVSSAQHTRRASIIFKSVFSHGKNPVKIFCSPSRYSGFNGEKWWRRREGIRTVLMEYLKMAEFLMFERSQL
jgi:uncharacterized SAM-binding protein YcdF (DUF218 family)